MTTTWERLQNAFVEDHRSMTRGYRELIELLDQGDFVAASHAASRLDTIAGPHIEFEEKYLYPHVAKSRGNTYMSRLFDEHDDVATTLVEILSTAKHQPPDQQSVARWLTTLIGRLV